MIFDDHLQLFARLDQYELTMESDKKSDRTTTLCHLRARVSARTFKFIEQNLEAPPGFEPGVEVLQT
jgi:hypothetical protein